MKVRFRRLPQAIGLPSPQAATSGSAGFDLRAAVKEPETLAPGQRGLIPTGLSLEIPPGWEGQVRPRSGLALHQGVTVANAPGTIDSDYRGEIGVILINHGQEPFTVERGDRIAQLVVAAVPEIEWQEADSLEGSGRGAGGFGSTGTD